MAATKGSNIKFVYVSTGQLPASVDADTVYFVEGVGLYVGGELISNVGLTEKDIEDFGVKSVTITGTGTAIVDAVLGADKVLTLTKGTPFTLSKGVDTSGTAQTLTPGGTFTVMTDTTITDDSIADVNTEFTLPDAITTVDVTSSRPGYVEVTSTWSNGTETSSEVQIEGITGAMHFIGVSTTAITDGGTETPTINGEAVTPETGDVVIFGAGEFVWNGSAWAALGDASSYALKTITVTGGSGLTGGGDLTANREISHAVPTGATAGDRGDDTDLTFIKKITTDEFGHVTNATTETITIPEYEFADEYDAATNKGATVATVTNAINALDAAEVGGAGNYISTVSQTDGVVTATVGTKGAVAANDTNLVDGGTVHAAIQDVKEELAVLWDVINV